MFIRKKRNKSGSYSVYLVVAERVLGKRHPIPKVIKNFGSANTPEELKHLIEQAEAYKGKIKHLSSPKKILKISSELDIKDCYSYNIGFTDIYGNVFDRFFHGINLKPVLKERLKDLIIMRIAEPASKRHTAKIGVNYGQVHKPDDFYKLMDHFSISLIEQIKKITYSNTSLLLREQKKSVDVLFYDLTTVYFETGTQNEIKNFGFSKDGKHQHVQIMLAIIVTQDGLPIDYEEFPGNSYEGHTLIPVLNKIRARYQIEKAVIVADAALMNKINLQELNDSKINYIIAAKIKNTSKETKKLILNLEEYKPIKTIVNQEDGVILEEIKTRIIKTESGDSLIAFHSLKRQEKDIRDREKSIDKIQKYLGSTLKNKLTSSLKKPYVKISKDSRIEIDQKKLEADAKWDGFFGIITNVNNPSPTEILNSYRGLWQVEQTFRIAKSNLEIRPVFHFTAKRIKAHFAICYIALALVRFVEFILKYNEIFISIEDLHFLLEKMRKIKLTNDSGDVFSILETPPSGLSSVYLSLNIPWPKKFENKIIL